MSFLLRRSHLLRNSVKQIFLNGSLSKVALSVPVARSPIPVRTFSITSALKFSEPARAEETTKPPEEGKADDSGKIKGRKVEIIPVETSIRYLRSKAYSITYGNDPVWKNYRRNFKGQIPPRHTRKRCIRAGVIGTGNPCPICRDDYLVLSPENTELLKQFICPYTGRVLSYSVTGICQRRHKELLSAIDIAKDRGSITFDVPFREYNYSEYKK